MSWKLSITLSIVVGLILGVILTQFSTPEQENNSPIIQSQFPSPRDKRLLSETMNDSSFHYDKKFQLVEGGSFAMGQPNPDIGSPSWSQHEQPVHTVIISSFIIGRYEVTTTEFCQYLNSDQSHGYLHNDTASNIHFHNGKYIPNEGKDNHPITGVSWFDAKSYCKWAGGRLPTEAEWEYAARGGLYSRGFSYSGGNQIRSVCWYRDNTQKTPKAVGQLQSNELDIYDMSGNVYEWCSDWADKKYYKSSPEENPQGPSMGIYRVMRGGSWFNYDHDCRATSRMWDKPVVKDDNIGFRLVKDITIQKETKE